MAGILWGSILATILIVLFVLVGSGEADDHAWEWIDVVRMFPRRSFCSIADDDQVYTMGYIKLLVTLVKYMPQVWLNRQRQSTQGWSIGQILLDFSGGVFSLLQLLIDSSFQPDWSGVTGNPVKLGLSNASIFFDLIFMVQHYVIYPSSNTDKISGRIGVEHTRLLPP